LFSQFIKFNSYGDIIVQRIGMTHFTYIFEVVTNQREHDSVQNII